VGYPIEANHIAKVAMQGGVVHDCCKLFSILCFCLSKL